MPRSDAAPDICSQVLGSLRAGELDRFDRVQTWEAVRQLSVRLEQP